jgi:hypothetical protein
VVIFSHPFLSFISEYKNEINFAAFFLSRDAGTVSAKFEHRGRFNRQHL